MSDIFDEVNEELQREKMALLWKRYGRFFAAAALLLVVGTAFWSFYASHTARMNVKNTAALLEAVETADTDRLISFAKETKTAHAALANLIAASQLTEDGETEKAIGLYDAIIDASATDSLFKDLARILKISLQMDQEKPDLENISAALARIDNGGNPWRFSARELQGLVAAQKGDYDNAAKIFENLAGDNLAPKGLRERALALTQLYSSLSATDEKKNAS